MSAEAVILTRQLEETYVERIRTGMRELLQTKHLYQRVDLRVQDLGPQATKENQLVPYDNVRIFVRQAFQAPWIIKGGRDRSSSPLGANQSNILRLTAPDVKLHCHSCNRIEAFNSIGCEDIIHSFMPNDQKASEKGATIQAFTLSFECQSCKGVPDVFLIRREGTKLVLSGRAPMEHVEVPNEIPPSVRQYYRRGQVASQSGEFLCGNFLLRTLIEQWVYGRLDDPSNSSEVVVAGEESEATIVRRADNALEAYAAGLPTDFKDRFPSLTDLYSTLSADIHAANGDPEVYEQARAAIVLHFDARRLYKL